MLRCFRFLTFAVLFFGFLLATERQAHAYADPGSGMLILQTAVSILTGIFYVCSRRIQKVLGKRHDR